MPTACAVIGVGYLGKFHARKYAELPNADLVAVADIDEQSARASADQLGCRFVTNYRELLGQVEAVSIAVPTVHHFEVARDFLESGAHVLIEKPIATTVEQARELNDLAENKGLLLQVGHLERFNAAFLDLADFELSPLFIESHRLAPFKQRATDVNVVLDLMIHDIDLILAVVDSPLTSIRASGTRVLSGGIDIVNARLEFDNGCAANVTASRVSMKSERKMQMFQNDAYISIDFQNSALAVCRVGEGGARKIERHEARFGESDVLKVAINSFLDAIQCGQPVVISGRDGERALEAAISISDMIESGIRRINNERHSHGRPQGAAPQAGGGDQSPRQGGAGRHPLHSRSQRRGL